MIWNSNSNLGKLIGGHCSSEVETSLPLSFSHNCSVAWYSSQFPPSSFLGIPRAQSRLGGLV